jgi:hypothetical protein
MKPYDAVRGRRKKRDHRVKCLRCEQIFLSRNLKTNRICEPCKNDHVWRLNFPDFDFID